MSMQGPQHLDKTKLEFHTGNEDALIEALRRGSEDAWEALFRAHYSSLVAFVETQVPDRTTAEEIVDEIFLDIWRRGSSWRLEGSLRPYLYGAARKKCLIHYRDRARRTSYHIDEDVRAIAAEDQADMQPQVEELSQAVDEAVELLPERRRLVFMLSRYHGLSYAEIAAVLDLSTNTVRNQLARALQFLRQRLASYL